MGEIVSENTCNRCHGEGRETVRLYGRNGRSNHGCGELHIVVCDQCEGLGIVTQERHQRIHDSY